MNNEDGNSQETGKKYSHWICRPRLIGVEDWKQYLGWGPVQFYPAGIEVYRQGSWTSGVHLIEQGLVKCTWLGVSGQTVILGLCAQGCILNSATVSPQTVLLTTAETVTACCISYMTAEKFSRLVSTDRDFSWRLHLVRSEQLRNLMWLLAMLKCVPAERRLRRFLWEMASALEPVVASDPTRLGIPLKHWELAQMIHVTPEHLCRLLGKLEKQGILSRQCGNFIIPNADKLRDEVGSQPA